MVRRHLILAATLAGLATAAHAQSPMPGGMPPPPGMSLAASNAMRFPQPVRAGDLRYRTVLRPVESQTVLGHVRELVRDDKGTIMAVIDFGGFLGFGTRPIAVPIEAMVLLGADMEIVAFTPAQLRGFPDFAATGTAPIPDDTILKIGLAKPSH
jgi:hypothetical protein